MASKQKRYISDISSSEEDSYEDLNYHSKKDNMFELTDRTSRKPRCLSKNALMARENRLKKKMYVNKLEREIVTLKTDNKRLSSIVENQSSLVTELKREVKYLKSVIANSSDIRNLVRNIHSSTGMSVSSSLDKNLSLKNVYVAKHQIEERIDKLEEIQNLDDSLMGNDVNWFGGVSDYQLNISDDIFKLDTPSNLEEHNYTTQLNVNDEVGVCLHVSKHKVSLEFCTKCSEKAEESWRQL